MSYPITANGFNKIKEELNNLKKVERPLIIERIAIARSHGDLSENAEYHAAREKHSFIEGRITYLEGIVADAQVIDPLALSGEKVLFGATVTVYDVDADEEVDYNLVGEIESDVENNRLSVTSPIGRALIGKMIGDTAVVDTPGGKRELEILDVKFI